MKQSGVGWALARELRERLLYAISPALLVFVGVFVFNQTLLNYLLSFIQSLSSSPSLVVFHWFEGVEAGFALAWYATLLLCMPWWVLQLWWFLAPALYEQERQMVSCIFLFGGGLFYLGAVFGGSILVPVIFDYAHWFLPSHMPWILSLSACLHLIWTSMIFSGVVLQMPVLCSLLVYGGVLRVAVLQQARPYVIVGLFILGMLCTPPDMFAQIFFALPTWGLFEVSLFLAGFLEPQDALQIVDV